MASYKPRVLSIVVASLHIAWTIRILYFIVIDLIDYTDEDNQQLSEDGIFDMPIPGVRYLLLLWLMVFLASVILTIGIIMNRPLMLACFLLTMMAFIVIFFIFGSWGFVASLLKGTPFGSIVEELIYDSGLLTVEFVILHPVYLLYLELLESDEPEEINEPECEPEAQQCDEPRAAVAVLSPIRESAENCVQPEVM